MKKIKISSLLVALILLILSCDRADALKAEAFLEIENNSTSYNITGVYYANSGYGSNRISSNIGPGGSKTFTLSADDDYIYNIMVTTDDPALSDYTFDDVHFYDDRRIYIYLTNDGWDDYYPW
ncbi:MAG: hypothetical protein KOO66_08940 [Bacteroidales bacterium]|nr:hypothetical protein [Bacteroidales bacterium]